MNKSQELLSRIDGDPYNEVSGHPVKGGVVVMLSHRITTDVAALVFVPEDRILFLDDLQDEPAYEHINNGGDWPGLEYLEAEKLLSMLRNIEADATGLMSTSSGEQFTHHLGRRATARTIIEVIEGDRS